MDVGAALQTATRRWVLAGSWSLSPKHILAVADVWLTAVGGQVVSNDSGEGTCWHALGQEPSHLDYFIVSRSLAHRVKGCEVVGGSLRIHRSPRSGPIVRCDCNWHAVELAS